MYRERVVAKSRKIFRCSWCGERILKGEHCVYISSVYDGDFFTGRHHPECHRASRAWTVQYGYNEEWPERGSMFRGSTVSSEEAESAPPEYTSLPYVPKEELELGTRRWLDVHRLPV